MSSDNLSYLKKRIGALDQEIRDLDSEIIVYARRLWLYYESFVDYKNILKRIKDQFGSDKVDRIIDEYLADDKPKMLETLKRKDLDNYELTGLFYKLL